jgi:hypothetical protein
VKFEDKFKLLLFIIEELKAQLLEPTEYNLEYKFYGKFNIHFIQFAINYRKIHSLELSIAGITPTLRFILKSTEILGIFNLDLIDPVIVHGILNSLTETCIVNELLPSLFSEKLEIVLRLNQEAFNLLESMDKIIFTDSIISHVSS